MSHKRTTTIKPLRLTRWLSQLGYVETRREAESFIYRHTILVQGKPVTRGDVKVLPQDVTINGEPMDSPRIVIMVHKPAGYVCSHEDAGLRVYDLLPERYRYRSGLVTVGRLDKDTTGLLLMTDDGDLVHRLTHPKKHIAKTYEVTLEKPLSGNEATVFSSGTLMLDNEKTPLQPAMLEPTGTHSARLILHEGRYHQVKRMFAATGNHVTQLHRSAIGKLELDTLAVGQWRLLSEEEEHDYFNTDV